MRRGEQGGWTGHGPRWPFLSTNCGSWCIRRGIFNNEKFSELLPEEMRQPGIVEETIF